VRVLFCLFAEDTGIFERESFNLYLLNRTAKDGSDLGFILHAFSTFSIRRRGSPNNLDETLAAFPYVNGELFAENLGFADFTRICGTPSWAAPASIGPGFRQPSLFALSGSDEGKAAIGAHYTSERDILKVVRSLFLDDLRAEFNV